MRSKYCDLFFVLLLSVSISLSMAFFLLTNNFLPFFFKQSRAFACKFKKLIFVFERTNEWWRSEPRHRLAVKIGWWWETDRMTKTMRLLLKWTNREREREKYTTPIGKRARVRVFCSGRISTWIWVKTINIASERESESQREREREKLWEKKMMHTHTHNQTTCTAHIQEETKTEIIKWKMKNKKSTFLA